MGLIQMCLRNPAAVAVMVAITVLLGFMSVLRLPVQLFPDIERPRLGIEVTWRAASPSEVEAELIEPIEEVLQGVPGMIEMESMAGSQFGNVEMTFSLETDMQLTILDVLSRLNRLPTLPVDSDPPRLIFGGGRGGGGGGETLIFFFVQVLPGNSKTITDYFRFLEDDVIPRIEAIPGVAGVQINNGNVDADELKITFDPFKAAEYGIVIPSLANLVSRSDDVSGGFVDVGRRQYILQYKGEFSPTELENLILEWREGRPVRLGDIATVEVGPGRRTNFAYQNGNPAASLRILRDNNANVLATIDEVKSLIDEMRDTAFKERGLDIQQSFDPSVFINRAIALVTNNLVIGVSLAIGILWLFLRRPRATVLIASTIPICLLTTFLVLDLAGRSINVISLAGLAFATGMVLDAAIVVLENIVRWRERGADVASASETGTSEVWGALLASTATTVAIFLPVIFIKDVEGQIFADLALTIAIAVSVSFVVAVTVLPTGARLFVRQREKQGEAHIFWDRITGFLMGLTATPSLRRLWIVALVVGSGLTTWVLLPSLNYLPPVKRDAVDVWFDFPEGITLNVIDREVAQVIVERLDPFMKGEREPKLKNWYFLVWPGGGTIGARVEDQSRAPELETIMREEILAGLPDTRAFAQQGNLFGGFGGGGGGIAIHLQSSDPAALGRASIAATRALRESLGSGADVRTFPNPTPTQPELQIYPKDDRILEGQWTRAQIAQVIRALGDGLFLGEYFDGEKRLDIILRGGAWTNPDQLAAIPIVTPSGATVPLGELVTIERSVGPSTIRRVEKRRTVTLWVGQPQNMALQDVVELIQTKVEPIIREILPNDGGIRYGGSADSLNQAIGTMTENFVLALGLLFMLMAALFRSLRDSALVLIAIPLATVGGMAGLQILNLFTNQPLDLLTMIGFIILLGLVVNNAILLVDRTRRGEAEGLSRRDAVADSLRRRLRPIFMSTLTSIFGMLPLVLVPGTGSAIYRGLATAIVGGMAVSLVFTLILLPSLLRLGENKVSGTGAQPAEL